MGLSPKSNYEKKKNVCCLDIGEVPRSPGKWNWNWLYFLPFIFTFEQGVNGGWYALFTTNPFENSTTRIAIIKKAIFYGYSVVLVKIV